MLQGVSKTLANGSISKRKSEFKTWVCAGGGLIKNATKRVAHIKWRHI